MRAALSSTETRIVIDPRGRLLVCVAVLVRVGTFG
jgi:hypothetical protein